MLNFQIININETTSPLSAQYTLTTNDFQDGYVRVNTNTSEGSLIIPSDEYISTIYPGTRTYIKNNGIYDLKISGDVLFNLGYIQTSSVNLPAGDVAKLIKVSDNEWKALNEWLEEYNREVIPLARTHCFRGSFIVKK